MQFVTHRPSTLESVDEFLGPDLDYNQRQPLNVNNIGVDISVYFDIGHFFISKLSQPSDTLFPRALSVS